VGIEEVHPREGGGLAPAHDVVELAHERVGLAAGVAVDVVGAGEAEVAVAVGGEALALGEEDPAGEHRRGGVARPGEASREVVQRLPLPQRNGLVEVLARVQRRERVAGVRGLGVGAGEDGSSGGEGVEGGGERAAVDHAAEAVGAHGVDGDQQHVGALPAGERAAIDARRGVDRGRGVRPGDGRGAKGGEREREVPDEGRVDAEDLGADVGPGVEAGESPRGEDEGEGGEGDGGARGPGASEERGGAGEGEEGERAECGVEVLVEAREYTVVEAVE
jgi:hypothetical protein